MRVAVSALLVVLSLSVSPLMAAPIDIGVDAFFDGNYRLAYKILKPLAKKGNAEAQYILGGMYSDGLGVDEDSQQGIYWLEKAVEQYHRDAAITLSKIYLSGRGIPIDTDKGRYYLGLANEFVGDEPPEDDCD